MQMGLVAGRDLQSGGLDLDETGACEPAPQGVSDAAPRRKIWPAGGMRAGQPERRTIAHIYLSEMVLDTLRKGLGETLASCEKIAMVRPQSRLPPKAASHLRQSSHLRIVVVKVIASQLRKGNIVDIDGKLYVVLNAESFHPGKGTPTTQVDMRRISDRSAAR